MGWLSAIGAGGGQAVDRYSQWRQLDQENQWKEAERQRQARLDEQNRLDAELQRKATQLAVTKGELGNITDRLSPGAAVDEPTIAELNRLGAGHLFDPTTRTFRGTFEQQQAHAKAQRDTELYALQKQEHEAKLAEMTRQQAAQKALDEWAKANPKAGAKDILGMSARLGVAELPPALKAIVDFDQQRAIVGMQTQAQIEAARMRQKLEEDALTKQRAQLLREQYRTAPKGFAELLADRSQKLYEKGEAPTPQMQTATMFEWLGMRPQLAALEQELKMPSSGYGLPQGSPYFKAQLQQLPAALTGVLDGSVDPDELMAKINNNPQLSGEEKLAMRQMAREFLNPTGIQLPVYTGNEGQPQPPSPLASAIRPTTPITRQAVGNGR